MNKLLLRILMLPITIIGALFAMVLLLLVLGFLGGLLLLSVASMPFVWIISPEKIDLITRKVNHE